MELPHTFENAGLHEIFVDFSFVDYPDTVYAAPDFLFDIQPSQKNDSKSGSASVFIISALLGFIAGVSFSRWQSKKD